MEINFTLIGIALATMFFGYFFGLFEGRGQGYRKRRKEEAVEIQTLPPAAPPDLTEKSSPAVLADDPGILRLKNANQQLTLELDGRQMNTSALSPAQKKRLIELLTLMRPWLEGGSPVIKPTPSPVAATGATRAVETRIEKPVPAAPASAAPEQTSQLESNVVGPAEEKPSAAQSMVAQIDSLLHARLMNTPLASKGIRLQESPEGAVTVWVGIQKYHSLDDVPDAEIKAAIRSAIAAWEQKFTPGA